MIEIDDFILIPTKNQSKEDWLKQRSLTVGGSDMGTLFNKNEYSSVTQLFYEKLGRVQPVDLSSNSAVHYGSSFEAVVLRDSQYLDLQGQKNNHIKNFNDGKKKASHLPFPYMIISKKYPQITCNVDGLKFADTSLTEQDLIDMVEKEGKMPIPQAIIECKTMSVSSKEKWKGLNPSYYVQVKTYCLPFLELNPYIYGEIYAFCYDQTLTGYRVDLEEKDKLMIPLVSKKFQELVQSGREIISKAKSKGKNDDEINEMLSQIHPAPNSSADSLGSFLSDTFLKKQYIKENATIKGTKEDIDKGLRSCAIGEEIKALNTEKAQISNDFKNKLVTKKARIIDCGDRGKISYLKRLTINIK
jgi:predicted phage-related endonuclease